MNIRRLMSVNWPKTLYLSLKNACKNVVYNKVAIHIDASAVINSTVVLCQDLAQVKMRNLSSS